MTSTVQARLDDRAEDALAELMQKNGWSRSQAIRESLVETRERHAAKRLPRLIGVGCVSFGPGDMATNKKYLKDLGVKSMGKGWRPPQARAR